MLYVWRQAVTVGAMRDDTRERIWKFLIIVAIGLAAGPDIFAALEMRILLELLGAALFTTAFVVGARLALADLRSRARDILVPPPQRALLHSEARTSDKLSAALYQLFHLPSWLGLFTLVVIAVVIAIRGV
jgi:hypothetical protein